MIELEFGQLVGINILSFMMGFVFCLALILYKVILMNFKPSSSTKEEKAES
jgi:hypothetical protein